MAIYKKSTEITDGMFAHMVGAMEEAMQDFLATAGRKPLVV